MSVFFFLLNSPFSIFTQFQTHFVKEWNLHAPTFSQRKWSKSATFSSTKKLLGQAGTVWDKPAKNLPEQSRKCQPCKWIKFFFFHPTLQCLYYESKWVHLFFFVRNNFVWGKNLLSMTIGEIDWSLFVN